jgi:hypothetical protein
MVRAFYWSLSVGHIVGFSMKNDNKVEIRHKNVKLFFCLKELKIMCAKDDYSS